MQAHARNISKLACAMHDTCGPSCKDAPIKFLGKDGIREVQGRRIGYRGEEGGNYCRMLIDLSLDYYLIQSIHVTLNPQRRWLAVESLAQLKARVPSMTVCTMIIDIPNSCYKLVLRIHIYTNKFASFQGDN